jgi:hypothetical protein
MTPLRPPQWILLCKLGSKSRGLSCVNDTAEAVDLEFKRLWPPLKGIKSIKNYIGKLYYPISITITQNCRGYLRIVFGLSGVIDTAQAKIGDFKSNIFTNSKPYAKRLKSVYQGPGGSCLMKKKPEVENLVTLSL